MLRRGLSLVRKRFRCTFGLAVTVSVLALQFHVSRSEAEPCWMIGCAGRVGYVFMPDNTYQLAGKAHYKMDGQECIPPPAADPFGEDVLPDVNSVQTIVIDNTPLIEAAEISSHLGSFPPVSIIRDSSSGKCQAVRKFPRDVQGDPMKAGAKVKVLGYQTFVSQRSETGSAGAVTRHGQLLFALVLVQTDTR